MKWLSTENNLEIAQGYAPRQFLVVNDKNGHHIGVTV